MVECMAGLTWQDMTPFAGLILGGGGVGWLLMRMLDY